MEYEVPQLRLAIKRGLQCPVGLYGRRRKAISQPWHGLPLGPPTIETRISGALPKAFLFPTSTPRYNWVLLLIR